MTFYTENILDSFRQKIYGHDHPTKMHSPCYNFGHFVVYEQLQ